MRKRLLAALLTAALAMGLCPLTLAAETPDFADVPTDHWAYEPIMDMARQGVMKGVGGDRFDPNGKLTAEMFIVLLGRVVFPDVTADDEDWSGPYITAMRKNGLLAGCGIDMDRLTDEITRYDMACVLQRTAAFLGAEEYLAQPEQVADHDAIPEMYTQAVLAAYGMGLIRGDQNGNFNGAAAMTRAEVAAVVARVSELKKTVYETSRTGEYMTFMLSDNVVGMTLKPGTPIGLYYKDGRLLGQTVVDDHSSWTMEITMDKADFDCIGTPEEPANSDAIDENGDLDPNIWWWFVYRNEEEYEGRGSYYLSVLEPSYDYYDDGFYMSSHKALGPKTGPRRSRDCYPLIYRAVWGEEGVVTKLMLPDDTKIETEELECEVGSPEWYALSRTGQYVTKTFRCRLSEDIAGVPVGVYFVDGRLLGQGITDEEGKCNIEITLDRGDYTSTKAWYYAAAIGQVEGSRFGLSETRGNDYRMSGYQPGGYIHEFFVPLYPVENPG